MSNFPLLEKKNKRRDSQDVNDIAFIQHVESCFYTYGGINAEPRCNTVDGLCPSGQRLDELCPGYEREPVTALDIFLLAAEIIALRQDRATVEKIAREEEAKNAIRLE